MKVGMLGSSKPLRGVIFVIFAVLLFVVLDTQSKQLSANYPVSLLTWARYTGHCLLMIIFLAPSMRTKLVATRRLPLQLIRALCLVAITYCAMKAFSIMPLPEATAIIFTTPLLVTLLAGPVLGERVKRIGWFAVVLGFIGVLLVAQPSIDVPLEGVVYAGLTALVYSLYQILTRLLSGTESPITLLFYTALVGTIVMSAGLPWFGELSLRSASEGLRILALGIYGGTGHFLLILAFRHAPASLLAPIFYVQLIFATFSGWWVFGHIPQQGAILGMCIIALAGVLVGWQGRSRR